MNSIKKNKVHIICRCPCRRRQRFFNNSLTTILTCILMKLTLFILFLGILHVIKKEDLSNELIFNNFERFVGFILKKINKNNGTNT